MAGIKATLGWCSGRGAATEAEIRRAFDAAFNGPDFAEGAQAFLAKRAQNSWGFQGIPIIICPDNLSTG